MESSSATAQDGGGAPGNFIRDIIAEDLAGGRCDRVHTRFPPEPNGLLHIGHAKAICLNFGLAREFGGVCNLRMDDTNPSREEAAYVDSIVRDVRWLIGGWADGCVGWSRPGAVPAPAGAGGAADYHLPPSSVGGAAGDGVAPFHASSYFDALYAFAERLIEKGKAYVCELSAEETEAFRGPPDRPGRESPFRDRPSAESLALFRRMRDGEFPDGSRTLKARIDMASPNIWLRDPVLYRIRHAAHHQTGEAWRIYPLYDFAHCLSDYIEGVTHSLCTLEFEVHRPLYDWILEALDLPRPLPRQYEFARLNLTYTVMSKRKLLELVRGGHVNGWDDPRLPTISGIRRRGVPAPTLRSFVTGLGVTKYKGTTDLGLFEHAVRNDLNKSAARRMAVLDPLRVTITNLPADCEETMEAVNNPEDPDAGTRAVPFSRDLLIERQDFLEDPPRKFFRLRPGGEVRLKYAFIIRCDEVEKDADGRIVRILCTADVESRSGRPGATRKVKGTIHWVSERHAVDAEVRLYDRLFTAEDPDAAGFLDCLNTGSLRTARAKCEPALAGCGADERFQLERLCYIAPDPDSRPGALVFNRIVTLRDSWARRAG